MLTLEILEIVLRFLLIGMGIIAMVGWKRDGDRLDRCRDRNRHLEEENAMLTAKLKYLELRVAEKRARELFEEVEK